MGYDSKCENSYRSEGFRVIQLAGRLYLERVGVKSFNQILLLNNDLETLLFVEEHLNSVVNNAVMVKKQEYTHHDTGPDEFAEFCRNFEPLINAVIMRPEKNLFLHMTSSLKKAILSIAIDRCNSDRTTICNALGLSDGELDEELRLCGLMLSDKP